MVSGTSHLGFQRTIHLIVGVGVRSPYGLPAEFLCLSPLPISRLEFRDYSSRLAEDCVLVVRRRQQMELMAISLPV